MIGIIRGRTPTNVNVYDCEVPAIWHSIPDYFRDSMSSRWLREKQNEQSLLQDYYDFHIAGNALLTILETTLKDYRRITQVSLLYY